MTSDEARKSLDEANIAISTDASLIRAQMPVIERFLRESRNIDNFGHIVDPTLFNSSERRAADAILKPIYEAARQFLLIHQFQVDKATKALAEVTERDDT